MYSAQNNPRQIKEEANQLGVQNFVLIDVIAQTRALEIYLDRLNKENYDLNGGGLVPLEVAQKELEDTYEDEINRLENILKVCNERLNVVDLDKKQAEDELNDRQKQDQALDKQIEKLEDQVEDANKSNQEAQNEIKALEHELQELESTMKFREALHRQELKNVAQYVGDYNNEVEREEQNQTRLPTSSGHPSSDSIFSPTGRRLSNMKDDRETIEVLEKFSEQYQELLDSAYQKETDSLKEEIARLDNRHEDLKSEIEHLRVKQHQLSKEIEQMRLDKQALVREYALLDSKRGQDKKSWKSEREQQEDQIVQIGQEISKKERELAVLIDLDNKITKETIALEMEITGYKAMMQHENY